MPRWFWVEGRLAWAPVAMIVFASASIVGVDLAWRLVKMQFDTLLIYAALADMTVGTALILAVRLVRRRFSRRRSPSGAAL